MICCNRTKCCRYDGPAEWNACSTLFINDVGTKGLYCVVEGSVLWRSAIVSCNRFMIKLCKKEENKLFYLLGVRGTPTMLPAVHLDGRGRSSWYWSKRSSPLNDMSQNALHPHNAIVCLLSGDMLLLVVCHTAHQWNCSTVVRIYYLYVCTDNCSL